MRNKNWIAFIVIISIAILLRFYQLGQVPPSPDWDEVAIGYNAYSILKTGKDEYGTFLPLSFRSFDDYKPPLYVYLTVPTVAIFGLDTRSTRLPSAVMGVLAVIGTYFLVKELFVFRQKTILPLLSSFLLAISPWHIQFSRIAFEANTGVTINIWAVTCFLIGLRKKSVFLLSAFLFGLGMYAYHSQRVFLPLLLCILLVIYRRLLFRKDNRNIIAGFFIIGILTVLPLIPVLFNKTAILRLRGTSSFREQTEILSDNIKKLEYDRTHGYIIGELFDNRRVEYLKIIIRGYLVHFSPKWLFVTGDHERHHAPDMGLLYLWELPFLFLGIYTLLKTKNYEPGTKVLLGWFLISPIAASPTTQLPHAIRTLVFLPTFQIFTAFGIISVILFVKELRTPPAQAGKNKKLLSGCLLFIVFCFAIFNIVYYLFQYFGRTNMEYSKFWQYGYKEAVTYTESVKDTYKKVVVSIGLEQPYMFFLFYMKYDPVKYLDGGGTKSGSFDEQGNAFDKYEFRPLHWQSETFDGSILYVGSSSEIPHGNNAHITFLDGTPAIEIKDRKD